ncbi:hypothetical protein J6590_018480 [Homalodisca vitripennis]|nr:hypothetical protein J6590_067696 [Homalodisca vitripennis]KAG8303017.1 hypothetical protein J6590_018480 [Homalodisca vitripennis]
MPPTKYPCGTCTIGVKYSGIKCTGHCQMWYHAECVNISRKNLTKMSKPDVEPWICSDCKTVYTPARSPNKKISSPQSKSSPGPESLAVIQKKIQLFDEQEGQDLETSLALAAEAGSLLVQENEELKQELHNSRTENANLQTEVCRLKTALKDAEDLEDVLKLSENTNATLQDRNQELHLETQHLNRKLNQEMCLKEEIIIQAESDKHMLNSTINDLQRQLKENSFKFEQDTILLKTQIQSSSCTEEHLKKEIETKNDNLMTLQTEYDLLCRKLKDQEEKIKSCISTFLTNVKNNFSSDISLLGISSTNEKQAVGVKQKGYAEIMTQETTREVSQTPFKTQNPDMTRRDSQTPSEKLNQDMTRRDSQTPSKKLNQEMTRRDSQTPFKKLNQDMTRSDNNRLEPDTATNKQSSLRKITTHHPPLNARLRSHNETIEEFFNKNIDHYRQIINSYPSRATTMVLENSTQPRSDQKESSFLDLSTSKQGRQKSQKKEDLPSCIKT